MNVSELLIEACECECIWTLDLVILFIVLTAIITGVGVFVIIDHELRKGKKVKP